MRRTRTRMKSRTRMRTRTRIRTRSRRSGRRRKRRKGRGMIGKRRRKKGSQKEELMPDLKETTGRRIVKFTNGWEEEPKSE